MLECKDTGDVPRDPANDLCSGSRGHCPTITRGLAALFFLFYFPSILLYTCCLILLTSINSTNVQDEELRIGGIGRRMNSKVKVSQTRHVLRINMVVNLA
jgi:hypothetical protein